jgi:hypothetical protein
MASLTSSARGSSARSSADHASASGQDSNDNDNDLAEDGQADHDQDTSASGGPRKPQNKLSVSQYDQAMFGLIGSQQGSVSSS